MSFAEVATRVRGHYLNELRTFIAQEKKGVTRGSHEVKIELDAASPFLRHLYCVDFMKNDDGTEIVEFQPDKRFVFGPSRGNLGTMTVLVEALSWDSLAFRFEDKLEPDVLYAWFDKWFDRNSERVNQTAEFTGNIHSAVLKEGKLSVDMGTAPVEAFLELLGTLEKAGVKQVRITLQGDDEPPVRSAIH